MTPTRDAAPIRDDLERRLAAIGEPASRHVFTTLYPEAARAAADAADARRRAGISLGPLDGAMVSIKDLFDVAGEPTTAGSALRRTAAPAAGDAPVVARLRRAGAVILGKTNMSEFAFSGLGLNPHWGNPGNAADPSLVPGGSSSGAGVSAALGTSDVAIGTDTGGSVRIPAALNGVVGFKPTARRVPLDGAFPLSPTLDSIGPLARSVRACAEADAVLAGEEWRPLRPVPLRDLRIGVPRGLLFTETDADVAQAFEAALGMLGAAGARVADVAIDDLLERMAEATAPAPLASVEAAAVHADWIDAEEAAFDPRVHARISRGRTVTAATYIRMLRTRAGLIGACDDRLSPLDVLALPATAIPAVPIAAVAQDEAAFTRTNLLMLRNTMVGNLFDLTGISLPLKGRARPVGLMLLARHGQDRRLLEIAAAVEAGLR
ncbi:2-amino-5-chloromuconic acid deaminase [Methylobacterium crusticola]|uniref:2-amino-5-chloromuconic acid deaminase n=1 Tax=Methylobacterium crusticola TaxID=1697972 RepID=A0ABQ4R4L1_9HYPH|nr:amidase [Methylobacterium crusticola]GJD51895.1 2-amino-5-chloromuconic acid deaminase [Methylobacterium crusticola]